MFFPELAAEIAISECDEGGVAMYTASMLLSSKSSLLLLNFFVLNFLDVD